MNIKNLITNNTGVSIKNFFLFGVFILGAILLLVVAFILIWDVIHNNSIISPIKDLSTFIVSVSGMFVSAGLPKIIGDITENRNK